MRQNNFNDLELLKRAKGYMDKLAQGINPFTDEPAEDDSCINNVKLSNCCYFVSDILKQVIKNDGFVGKKKLRSPLLTDDILSELEYLDNAATITIFSKSISEVFKRYGMKGIPTTAYTSWLVSKHLLDEYTTEKNRVRTTLNAYSEIIGIYKESREGFGGSDKKILYSVKAQQFLIDNIAEIYEFYKESRKRRK